MRRVLVLGGYGGFGARLSRRLAADGWHVLVAGRNGQAAEALAATLPNASAVVVDRDGDLSAMLAREKPFLLIDAAGPFQGDNGHVIRAAIAAGVHYIDLADARDFVDRTADFDAAARAAGVVVVTGGSSVPALSSAVVAELAAGMDAVDAIETSISASNRATAGPSVARAILSYVGQPIRLWRGQRWTDATGWQSLKRETYAFPGEAPLHRLVALADVPDHTILPEAVHGRPATLFRAGPEFAWQLLALWFLSWLVRWRLLPSLVPLGRWLLPFQNLTRMLGSDRSAMKITVKGRTSKALEERSWTLVAGSGDGPEIPTLAAQLLARDLEEGRLRPGARNAAGLLPLARFRELLAPLDIREATVTRPVTPLYARIMGPRFANLPLSVRRMHEIVGDGGAAGSATVTRGTSPLARLVASVMGFPPAGEHAIHVHFTEDGGIETWTRDFSGQRFRSRLSAARGRLIERFGPLRFQFDLPSTPDGLEMVMRGWSFLHIPLPLALAPRSEARERDEGAGFVFDVLIRLPVIGLVVHYRGRLQRL